MVTNSVFITTVVSVVILGVSSMSLVVNVLGDRIGDLGNHLGGRIGAVEVRMNSLEGAVRDVGERLTVLETDFGNH